MKLLQQTQSMRVVFASERISASERHLVGHVVAALSVVVVHSSEFRAYVAGVVPVAAIVF